MVEDLKVKDFMSTELITLRKDATINEAADLLLEKNISSVVIMDSEELLGIVTDRDFIRLAKMNGTVNEVKDIMSKDLITINADEELFNAIKLMVKHKIRHLIVKEKEHPTGIISIRDALMILKSHAVWLNTFNKLISYKTSNVVSGQTQ